MMVLSRRTFPRSPRVRSDGVKRHFPPGIRYYAHTYEPNGVTRENWHLNPRAASANVLKHWEGIPKYLEWNHIEEIVRDGDAYS